jgi:cob(I)alamin adenosyltransferase
MESKIDKLEKELPPLYTFVIPGGHAIISHTHVARNICRRVERIVIKMAEKEEVNNLILIYLNRLSDYLFVLSRKFHQEYKINEIPWKPKV